jgi:hypothetical protein
LHHIGTVLSYAMLYWPTILVTSTYCTVHDSVKCTGDEWNLRRFRQHIYNLIYVKYIPVVTMITYFVDAKGPLNNVIRAGTVPN